MIPRIHVRRIANSPIKPSLDVEFQNPQLDGAFEILRIPKNHMRPFKWLKFGILAKQI